MVTTINRDELLKDVRNIINESMQQTVSADDVLNQFDIHGYITRLIETGHKNPELMNMLVRYDDMLNKGVKDFTVFEQFGNELARFSAGNRIIKEIISEMNETLQDYGMELMGYILIEGIEDYTAKQTIGDAFTNYIMNKCSDTLNDFIDSLDLLYEFNEPLATKLNLLITRDVDMSDHFIHTDYVDDSAYEELNRRIQEEKDRKLAEDIYEKVEQHITAKLAEQEASLKEEQSKLCLEYIANNQGLNLFEHLESIRNSDAATNERLMQVVNAYSEAVKMGAYEERLYETLIQNISKYSYLLPVEKAIKSINEKANERKEQIKLTQLLEAMKDDQYSFIYVNLIQEAVARYVNDPTPNNRVQLRAALVPHISDPYVSEIFNVLYADNTRSAELSEQAFNIKDQINMIKENVSISNIYTPVQYIKENECVFNVNGQYYIKKNNSIVLLEDKYVDQLDERFVELCHLVNDPHVEINENYIEVYGNNNMYAKVYEGYVDVLGKRESRESLRDLRTMCMKHDNWDTNFYIMCSCLHENFNNIAKVDWAKHVTLNENHNISADLFKLGNNIFIATHNESLAQHVFYRNVNPIFCKNKLNEHMGIKVSSLFSDLLPSQDKIILKLNETKNSYEESIEQYEDIIDQLKDTLAKASDENKKEIEDSIKDAEAKLDDIKSEYKEWQKQTDELTGEDADDEVETSDNADETDDETVITEPSNEPADDDEVENNYDELTTPIEQASDETADSEVSDEEFDNFLDMDDESEEDDTEVETDTEDVLTGVDTEESEEETDVVVDGAESDDEDVLTDFAEDEESEDEDIEDQEEFAEVLPKEGTEDTPEDIVTDDTLSDEDVFDGEVDDTEEDFDMEETEVEDDTYDGHEATDAFGGNVNNPIDVPTTPEVPENAPKIEGEEETVTPDFAYKIANVMFDENLKNGEISKSGSVIAIVPMVNAEGNSYVETKTVKFYLDNENKIILDNEAMTGDLYNAIITSIQEHPSFNTVIEKGIEAENVEVEKSAPAILPTETTDTEDDWEAEYLRDGNDEDRGEYDITIFDEDNEEAEDDNWDYANDLLKKSENDDVEDTTETEVSDEPALSTDFLDDESEEDETEDVIIPTYKSGDTEIELPASNVDDTIIPESVQPKKAKKHLKESIKIHAVYKKNGKECFFVNEATTTASKKTKSVLNNIKPSQVVSGNVVKESIMEDYDPESDEIAYDVNNPIEEYDIANDTKVISKLYSRAKELYDMMHDQNILTGEISDIKTYGDPMIPSEHIEYFDIEGDMSTLESGHYDAYRIFTYETNLYYISVDDAFAIIDDNRYEDKEYIIKLMVEGAEMCIDMSNMGDCMFMIESVIKSMFNYSTVNENCKIRKQTKIQTDNDIDKSVITKEAKYGTKEENDFKQELEDKQKKDGTIGALDPQGQEESVEVKPKLPNVNLLTEKKIEIEYEVNDKVIYKDNKWDVYAIDEYDGDKQRLHITREGVTEEVLAKDVEPDPEMLNNLEIDDMQFNNLEADDNISNLNDLNKKTVKCNIVVDGYKLNVNPMKVKLSDIVESNLYLDVEGDDETTDKMHVNSLQFDMENWPYAVLANEDDEPLRKIKVNPISYINAGEDDMVEVLVADKLSKLPKSSIRILS